LAFIPCYLEFLCAYLSVSVLAFLPKLIQILNQQYALFLPYLLSDPCLPIMGMATVNQGERPHVPYPYDFVNLPPDLCSWPP